MKTKSILSYFAAIISVLTLSMSFTSCSSDNDTLDQEEVQPQETKYRSVYLVTNQQVLDAATIELAVSDGREKVKVSLDTAKVARIDALPEEAKSEATHLIKSFGSELSKPVDDYLNDIRFVKVDIKYTGQRLNVVSEFKVKDNYTPSVNNIDVFIGMYKTSPKTASAQKESIDGMTHNLFAGLSTDKASLSTFFETVSSIYSN